MNNKFSQNVALFIRRYWKLILIWLVIIASISIGLYFHINKEIIAVVVLVIGIISNAFSGLVALIAMIPVLGPLLIKILSLPIFWVLNAIGYYVSVIAIKKGYGKDVINYRIITVIFLIGFAVGFVIAKII